MCTATAASRAQPAVVLGHRTEHNKQHSMPQLQVPDGKKCSQQAGRVCAVRDGDEVPQKGVGGQMRKAAALDYYQPCLPQT